MNIKEMGIEQLKVLIYDHLANVNGSQRTIQALEQELSNRKQAYSSNGTKEVKVETTA